MSRRPVPPARRKRHLVLPGDRLTVCGRTPDDDAVAGYVTDDPAEASCARCVGTAS